MIKSAAKRRSRSVRAPWDGGRVAVRWQWAWRACQEAASCRALSRGGREVEAFVRGENKIFGLEDTARRTSAKFA